MTKKSVIEASPVSTATVNQGLLEDYKTTALNISQYAVDSTIEYARALVASGDSVRNMRATLAAGKEWVKEYNLTSPSKVKNIAIPESKVEYLARALAILDTVSGADLLPIAELFTLANVAQRVIGADSVDKAIEGSDTLDDLNGAIDTALAGKPVKESKERSERAKPVKSIDSALLGVINAVQGANDLTLGKEEIAHLVKVLELLAMVARANSIAQAA